MAWACPWGLKSAGISLIVFSTLILSSTLPHHPFFSNNHHHPSSRRSLSSSSSCSDVLRSPSHHRCAFSLNHCNGDSAAFLNYHSLHFCLFKENPTASVPFLFFLLLLHFYLLVRTAQDRFSLVVNKLSSTLNLSPSMSAVTLLALGNGAPDVFSSIAAVRGGQPRTGFGAILSAGTFVSAFVVGFVSINAAPFSVDPLSFIRDVSFYLISTLLLFYVYLSGEIFLWQAIGFVGFYAFFVVCVFWMDLRVDRINGIDGDGLKLSLLGDYEAQNGETSMESDMGGMKFISIGSKDDFGILRFIKMVPKVWQVPVTLMLDLTIPQTEPSKWSRLYLSANIALCPLALLYMCRRFTPFNYPVVFFSPNVVSPLWFAVLFSSSSLALLHLKFAGREPPKTEGKTPVLLVAFVMSVFWISSFAGELLSCLSAISALLQLPSGILGLTVLAWGNSVGDLVADVAIARSGRPATAVAGCFAGPMFNMLVGLGSALVLQTSAVFPGAYRVELHAGIVAAFVFLLLGLLGSLSVVAWRRFRVPRPWGFCLVGLYIGFVAVSLGIAMWSR